MFFIYESPAPMKGEVFMKNERELDVSREMSVEEVYAEYVKKDITDDFIFGKIMLKEANCIDLLECLTGNRIESVSTVVSQKAVRITSDSKGVRYDIYVEDDKNIMYDAEMQNYTETTSAKNLPKRSRFYQGIMDLNVLEKGEDYNKLKQSYVIFICTFDPFGKGLSCYEFENICKGDKELSLGDERKVLFFNTKGTNVNVSKQVAELLYYMETKQVCNEFTKRLDSDVAEARQNREWMVEYMKTLVHDMDVMNEGIAKGRVEGKAEGKAEVIISFLEDQGEVPEDLRTRIYSENDMNRLKRWVKLSASVSSVDEFEEKMDSI